jgi:pilus assembly protein CpaE
MFPFSVVLAGCSTEVLPLLRQEFVNRSATIRAEIAKLDDLPKYRPTDVGDRHLFVLQFKAGSDIELLKRLKAVFIGQPVVVLIDGSTPAPLMLAIMRAGASQVVSVPIDRADFTAAIESIHLQQMGLPQTQGRLIAVSGVNGGCGGTTIALNLAYELAHQHSMPSILAELSTQVGMLVTHLEVKPEYNLGDVLRYGNDLDIKVVARALTPVTDQFKILPGPSLALRPSESQHADILRIVQFLRALASVVVLDLPATFDEHCVEVLATADQVVLVGEQRIPSIRNLQLMLDSLGRRAATECILVLNRYDPNIRGFALKDLRGLMELPRVVMVRNDAAFQEALNNGRPLRLEDKRAPALHDLEQLECLLLGIEKSPAAQGAQSSSRRTMGRFFHALGIT